MRFEYETPLRGIRWSVGGLARSAELSATEWTPGEVIFPWGANPSRGSL